MTKCWIGCLVSKETVGCVGAEVKHLVQIMIITRKIMQINHRKEIQADD